MTEKIIPIPARLKNVTVGGHVAGSEDIDAGSNKTQQQVNTEIGEAVAAHSQQIADLQAMEQIVIDGGEAQIAQGSDFDNPDAAKRAKVTTVGAVLDGINEGVFDLTAKTGDSYATLSDALTAANSAIPTNKKKGGMSIRFVCSSDNMYVQYFLTKDEWSSSEADWEKMNLEEYVSQLDKKVDGLVRKSRDENKALLNNGTYMNSNGSTTDTFDVIPGNTYLITGRVGGYENLCLAAFWDDGGNFITGSAQYPSTGTGILYSDVSVTAPANAATMKVCGNILEAYPNPPSAKVGAKDYGVYQKLEGLDSFSGNVENLNKSLFKQIITNHATYTDNSISFSNSYNTFLVVQRAEGGSLTLIDSIRGMTFSLSGANRLVLHANDTVEIVSGASDIVESDIVLLGLNATDNYKFGYGALFQEYLYRKNSDIESQLISIEDHIYNDKLTEIDSVYSNVLLYADGSLFNYGVSSLVVSKYIIIPDKKYSITGRVGNSQDYCVGAWYTKDGVFISAFGRGTNTPTPVLDMVVTAPSNAYFLRVAGNIELPYSPIVKYIKTLPLEGKTYSVMGDSIGTNNTGDDAEYTITANDVGQEITAWITWYDYNNSREDAASGTTKTIGGVTITSAMVGTQQTFIPSAEDVGKTLGTPRWSFNEKYPATPWWKITAEQLGLEYNASASWNGNSYTSHEENDNLRKIGYGWHPLQIERLAKRDAEGNRVSPDYIFLCRGTNDATHTPYAKITDFGEGIDPIPVNDTVTGGYGFKEAMAITISKIQNTYPSAKIYVCTLSPFRRLNDDTFPMDNGMATMQEYNKAVKEVAEYMGIKVIDFSKCWTFYNCVTGGYVNSSDFTHPVQKGHNAMAEQAIIDIMK